MSAEEIHRDALVPLYWGYTLGTLISGCILSQSVQWFTTPRTTRNRFEAVVVYSSTLFTVVLLFGAWIRGFAYLVWFGTTLSYTDAFHNSDFLWVLFCGLAGVMSQSWFVERAFRSLRAYRKTRVAYLALSVSLLATQVGCCFTAACIGFGKSRRPEYWGILGLLPLGWFISCALLDVITTTILIYQVRRLLKISSTQRSAPFRDAIRLSFTTGTLTTCVAVAGAVVYARLWKVSNAWAPLLELIPRISVFSCLYTINCRAKWQNSWRFNPGWSAEIDPTERGDPAVPPPPAAPLDTSAFDRVDGVPSLQKAWQRSSSFIEEDQIVSCHELEKVVTAQVESMYNHQIFPSIKPRARPFLFPTPSNPDPPTIPIFKPPPPVRCNRSFAKRPRSLRSKSSLEDSGVKMVLVKVETNVVVEESC